MSFIRYVWDILCIACTSAWGISGVITQIVSIIIGIIIWKRPAKEPAMKHLPWLIPLGVFVVWLSIMLIIAPYQIVKNQKEAIGGLQKKIDEQNTQKVVHINKAQLFKEVESLLSEINQFNADRDLSQPSIGTNDDSFQKQKEYRAVTSNLFITRYKQRLLDITHTLYTNQIITAGELNTYYWLINGLDNGGHMNLGQLNHMLLEYKGKLE